MTRNVISSNVIKKEMGEHDPEPGEKTVRLPTEFKNRFANLRGDLDD